MTEVSGKDTKDPLDPEVLGNIKPFTGAARDVAGRVIGSGQALQQVKTTYTTAVTVQQPRSITRVLNNVLEEARLAGQSFYWGWKVKDKQSGRKVPIEGPSIDLAMCCARNYGNCVIDVEGTETPTHFMLKGIFVDLETGFTVPRLFRQRKKQNVGSGYGNDRAEDMVFQIAQSKAQRNAIIKAMPEWLIKKAIEEAKKAETAKIENLAESRANAVQYFQDNYGVAQDRIESVIGRAADEWTKMDLVELKGTITAIKEGRVTADEAFPKVRDKSVAPAPDGGTPGAATYDVNQAPPKTVVQNPEPEVVTDPEPPPSTEPEPGPDPATVPLTSDQMDVTHSKKWAKLRRGTPAKGTGFAAYIKAHETAFIAAYPEWPDDTKHLFTNKYQGFYGEDVPFLAKDEPEPEPVVEADFDNLPNYPDPVPDPPIDEPEPGNTLNKGAEDQLPLAEPGDPDWDMMDRFNRIFTTGRNTPGWHYAQGVVCGDENTSKRPDTKDIETWLESYDQFNKNMSQSQANTEDPNKKF